MDSMDAVDWALPFASGHLGDPVRVEVMKFRPWGLSWRLSGPSGVAYLKAGAAATGYEAGLVAVLSAAAPDRIPSALATSGRWILLTDAGPTLRELSGEDFRLDVWAPMLTRFAGLQRTAESLAFPGVPVEDPTDFPSLVEALVPRLALSPTERDGVRRLAERWADLAVSLGRYGIATSIQHGDLHDGNVSLGADGNARFFDFGDASVSHPFTTMLIPLRVAASLGASAADAQALKLAYLEGYADLGPAATVLEALEVALEIAPAVRITSWDRALSGPAAPGDDPYAKPGAWGDAAAGWLRELLPAGD